MFLRENAEPTVKINIIQCESPCAIFYNVSNKNTWCFNMQSTCGSNKQSNGDIYEKKAINFFMF